MEHAASRAKYPLVQGLRAAAALCVAYHHIAFQARGHADPTMAWDTGVDVFFVISGFVIATSTLRQADRPQPARHFLARHFLARRLARIVPLYWAATTLFLASTLVAPQAIRGAVGGPGFIVASYLFVPAARPDGLVQPAFGLGWTLNYELGFYVLTGLALALRPARATPIVAALLGCLVALRALGLLAGTAVLFWSDPIVLEFAGGMLLAHAAPQIALRVPMRVALCGAAILVCHAQPDLPRLLGQGLPAIALVAAATLGAPASRPMPALDLLGDASYALYLVHPFVMRLGGLAWLHLNRAGGAALYIVLSLALAQCSALVIRARFERPANAWLRERLEAGLIR